MSGFTTCIAANSRNSLTVLAALLLSTTVSMAGGADTARQRTQAAGSTAAQPINEVVEFQQELWESQFNTTYDLGESLWTLDDGLPAYPGAITSTNSDGDTYSVTLFSAGEDPDPEDIAGLTAEEIATAELLQFQLIDMDGTFQTSDGTTQSFNGLGFSVVHPDTHEEISFIIPASSDLNEMVQEDSVEPGSYSRFSRTTARASGDENWWDDATCPKVKSDTCGEGEAPNEECAKEACQDYKERVKRAGNTYAGQVVEINKDLAKARESCKKTAKGSTLRNGLAIAGSILSFGLGGAADLVSRKEAYDECMDGAWNAANETHETEKGRLYDKVYAARDNFKQDVADCCESSDKCAEPTDD